MEDLAAERERVADEEEQREKEKQAAIDERIKKEIEFQKAVNKLQHETHLNSLSRDDEALQRIRDKYQLEFYQLTELMIQTDNLAMRKQAANDLDRRMAEELHARERAPKPLIGGESTSHCSPLCLRERVPLSLTETQICATFECS